jgi:hypothetical protein
VTLEPSYRDGSTFPVDVVVTSTLLEGVARAVAPAHTEPVSSAALVGLLRPDPRESPTGDPAGIAFGRGRRRPNRTFNQPARHDRCRRENDVSRHGGADAPDRRDMVEGVAIDGGCFAEAFLGHQGIPTWPGTRGGRARAPRGCRRSWTTVGSRSRLRRRGAQLHALLRGARGPADWFA